MDEERWVARSAAVGAAVVVPLVWWVAWPSVPEWGPVWWAAGVGVALVAIVVGVKRQAEWALNAQVAAAERGCAVDVAWMAARVAWGAFAVGSIVGSDPPHGVDMDDMASA